MEKIRERAEEGNYKFLQAPGHYSGWRLSSQLRNFLKPQLGHPGTRLGCVPPQEGSGMDRHEFKNNIFYLLLDLKQLTSHLSKPVFSLENNIIKAPIKCLFCDDKVR